MSRIISAGFLFLNFTVILTGCDEGDNRNKFIDYDSGIQWSETVGADLTDRESISFCKSMNENYDIDWKLPTVEQLADLVINCDDLDKCPDADDGRYSKFEDSGRFWSETIEYDTEGVLKSPVPARVYFDFDTLEAGYDNEPLKGKYKVRCVRTITD